MGTRSQPRSGLFRDFTDIARRAVRSLAMPTACLVLLGQGVAQSGEGPERGIRANAVVKNPRPKMADLFARDGKIRGVNLVAGRRFSEGSLSPLLHDHVEWLVLGPFGWQENTASTDVRLATRDVMWSESDTGIVAITRLARLHGMRIMLKPQIWITRPEEGKWLADIDPGSDANWSRWFDTYRRFILHYAVLAEGAGIEALCVGAELHRSVKQRPGDWIGLIAAVRAVYHGRLTYAANWNEEVSDVTFWDRLDFIGVQAYYPLTDKLEPSVADLVAAWRPISASLARLSGNHHLPILFTEVGWKSTPDAAARPWEWSENLSGRTIRVSTGTQARAYDAFFSVFWHEPWFAGALIWKWYANHAASGGPESIDFTPQNKPAESVMSQWFARVSAGRTRGAR